MDNNAATSQNPPLAAGLTLLASAFVAGTTLLAKALGTGTLGPAMHPLQISHGRFLFAFLGFATAAMILRPTLQRPNWKLHIGRSSLGWGGVTLMFAAAAFIPLSDATAISFLNPVVGMLLAIPFLGEKIGPWRWGSAALAFTGAMVLTRPGAGALELGAILALCAACFLGGEVIFMKKLTGRERPFQILLINNALGLTIASAVVIFVWQTPTPAQWAGLAGIGLLMATAQTCFINAMRLADASFVAPFFYAALAFAALYDAIIFGVIPDRVSWIGTALILCAAAILVWREARHASK
ncbi:DMT family transporter [Shimia marina]|uniref:Carboxylate/amino acid/amine transporter n=1 Tax=Shimia marina TaxID=321267 RepID=A0A0P1EUA8_9RHOB|nr:DMT family transporter [Shimia marina]CUH54184.1 carboxylate/amino acid/amine transporter [Shimia marina]SFD97239.1 EamA-like transporter family protein [Shimia marina]